MTRGLYIAGTGMLLQRRNMEVVTNNIVNSDTTGYKKDILIMRSFDDVMIRRFEDMGVRLSEEIGPLNFGARVDHKHTDYSIGSFEETGRNTDLALVGNVFFSLETVAGERYSRAGSFYVSAGGFLTDGDGNYLLGVNGPIYVGGTDFQVSETGVVTVAGVVSDMLRLASFEDLTTLRKQGDNLYFATAEPVFPFEYAVKQGFLETSNADVGREMVDMLSLFRNYETNQRMLTMIDELNGRAANEIARLR